MAMAYTLLLILFFVHCSVQEVYYVKPTSDHDCEQLQPCNTLSGYISQGTLNTPGSTVLMEFLPGFHNVSGTIMLSTDNLYMNGMSTSQYVPAVVSCIETSSIKISHTLSLRIDRLNFSRCSILVNKLVEFSLSNSIIQSSWHNAVVIIETDNVFVANSSFDSNTGAVYYGGALSITNASTIDIQKTNFTDNSCNKDGGAVALINSITILISSVHFKSNSARNSSSGLSAGNGGAVHILNSSNVTVDQCLFQKNKMDRGGGALSVLLTSSITIVNSTFTDNCAASIGHSQGGAMCFSMVAQIAFKGVVYMSTNKANRGGGVYIRNSEATFFGNAQFKDMEAYSEGGGIYSSNSTITFQGSTGFYGNEAEGAGGGIFAINSTLAFHGENETHVFTNCVSQNDSGGGMYLFDSHVTFQGFRTSFSRNIAYNDGGGIFGSDVTVIMKCKYINFTQNKAQSGGALLIDNDVWTQRPSQLSLVGTILFEANFASTGRGGAISVKYTRVLLRGVIVGRNNSASLGGMLKCEGERLEISGKLLILEGNSALHGGSLHMSKAILLVSSEEAIYSDNKADQRGGAIFALSARLDFLAKTDFINNSANSVGGALFVSGYSRVDVYSSTKLSFVSNNATKGGAIYVDDASYNKVCSRKSNKFCFLHPNKPQTPILFIQNAAISGTDIFGGMLDRCKVDHFHGLDAIHMWSLLSNSTNNGSSAVSSLPARVGICSQDGHTRFVLPTLYVHSGGVINLPSLVVVDQSEHLLPSLIITAKLSEGSKGSLGEGEYVQILQRKCSALNYHIISPSTSETLILYSHEGPCKYVDMSTLRIPIKMLPCPLGFEFSNRSNKCDCHKLLESYTTNCDIDTQMFLRKGNCWFDYQNYSLVAQEQCPFDFCSEVESITIAEIDKQCAHNRTGTLCGACKGNLSLSLGSSRCQECKSPSFIWLTLLFALAGVFLVAFLSIFRFTVALGTINGLIFYSNVVVINRNLLFPSGSTSNPLLVLLAWLNLDLGIETCYYDGMDMYSRTWLQFVFPLYVWSMVGVIILVSHYSTYAARVFGRNPVALLATLFLLSYTKLLRTIINIFSFVFLKYPETDTMKVVWLYDGNIGYFKGKHIPLFIVALLVLLFLFLPYTIVLLFGQCLRKYSGKRGLGWARSAVFTSVLDAYHAPYKFKHRYWTGLLLLVRCALFLTFSFNSLGDPTFSLLAVIITAMFLSVLAAYLKVYKTKLLNMLELSFLINMGVLSVIIHPASLSETNKEIVNNISLTIAFLVGMGIVVYHSYLQIRDTTLWKMIRLRLKQREVRNVTSETEAHPKNEPTRSVVELRNSNYLESLLESDSHQ